LDVEALTGWSKQSLAITKERYEKKSKYSPGDLGLQADLLGIYCESNLYRPIVYLNYDVKTETLRHPKSGLTLNHGSCTELQQGEVKIIVGLYSFQEPFSLEVPASDRIGRLDKAVGWFFPSSFEQTDHQVWAFQDILIGEAAGFLYTHVPGLIPHSTAYEKRTNNYYRLALVGERAMVAIDVYGTTSAPVDKLQSAAWPIVQALRFSK